MKKIINSIVTALMLSVILSVLTPQWFFKGDARWTYQNPTARVDVCFSGHLKGGRVNAEGADLEIIQPKELTNKSYQGTIIRIPVSYKNKTYRIKLTPQAKEWGSDASLVIRFMGRDFQYEGQRKPAWVHFQNITMNGKTIAGEKVVWHNKPFVFHYSPHSSEIILSFGVSKPLAASDIAFANFFVAFLFFLLPSLFFSPLRRAANHVMTFINRKDIVKVFKDGYLRIDPVYRRSFWIIFGVLCCAFGFHTIWYMWGNHDWSFMDHTHRWLEYAHIGRYMLSSVKVLLSDGVYLPFIYDAIILTTLAINAVLLCMYWRLEKRVIYYTICGLVLVAQPFTLCMVYFVHMTPEVFIGVTCALIALLLSERVAGGGGYITPKIVCSILSVVLINFTLAMYPVLLNTIAVAFVGRLLIQAFDWDGSRQQLKSYIKPHMIPAVNIVLGIALYKLVITYVFPVSVRYNTETLPLEQVPGRLGGLLKQSFHQLYEYNLPFTSQWILWVILGFTIVSVLYICFTGNVKQKVIRLFLLFGSLFATQVAMIIAKLHVVAGRVELFGLVFFEVLMMVVVITILKKLHNLWIIAGTCIIFASILNDLDCLRVWKLGFDAEKMLWNRVLARMEVQKDYDPARKYDVVLVGNSISMRPRYYTKPGKKDAGCGNFILYESYDHTYAPFCAPQFYYTDYFRGKGISSAMARRPSDRPGYEARLRRLYQAGVLQKAEVWPRPNGLIVWKDVILFVTDGKELEKYKRQFERELGKK